MQFINVNGHQKMQIKKIWPFKKNSNETYVLIFIEKILQPLLPFLALLIAEFTMGESFLDKYISFVALLSIQVNMVKSGTELVDLKENAVTSIQWILLVLSVIFMVTYIGIISAILFSLAAAASIMMEMRKKRGLILGYFTSGPLVVYTTSFYIAAISENVMDSRVPFILLAVWITMSLLMSARDHDLNGSFLFSLSTLNNWKETLVALIFYGDQVSEVFIITRVAGLIKLPLNIFEAHSLKYFHDQKNAARTGGYVAKLFRPNLLLTIVFTSFCIIILLIKPPIIYQFLFEGLKVDNHLIILYFSLIGFSCALGPFMYSVLLDKRGRIVFAVSNISSLLIYGIILVSFQNSVEVILISSAILYLCTRYYLFQYQLLK